MTMTCDSTETPGSLARRKDIHQPDTDRFVDSRVSCVPNARYGTRRVLQRRTGDQMVR